VLLSIPGRADIPLLASGFSRDEVQGLALVFATELAAIGPKPACVDDSAIAAARGEHGHEADRREDRRS